jgi:hypothetical protein
MSLGQELEWVVKPSLEFEETTTFSNSLSLVKMNTHYGYVNKQGILAISCIYEDAKSFNEGVGGVKINGKYGFINSDGKTIIPFEYENIQSFSEGLAAAKKKGRWGYIDKSGKVVIDFLFQSVGSFSEGLAVAFVDQKAGFIDKSGSFVIKPKYDQALAFQNGFAAVYNYYTQTYSYHVNSSWGFINKKGKEISKMIYDNVQSFSGGLASVKEKGRDNWDIINERGKKLNIGPYFTFISHFKDSIAIASGDDKTELGYINSKGKIIIPFKYYRAAPFSEQLAKVVYKTQRGFIDKTGKEIIPPQFEEVTSFSEGLAWVKKDGKWGIIKNPLLLKQKDLLNTLVNGIVAYSVLKQFVPDTAPPTITITSPKNAQERGVGKPIFTAPTLVVQGQITDNEKVTTAQLNGQVLAFQADGSFSQSVALNMGTNSFLIEATDAAQNKAAFRFEVERRAEATIGTAFGTYHALLIAAKDYKDPSITDLTFPVSDAQKLKEVLQNKYAFAPQNVKLLPNPTRSELLAALGRYSEQLTDKDNLLIFYAGHGEWDAKLRQGYWLLADANAIERGNWFSNADLKTYLGGISTKHTLLISDACFSGSIFQGRSNAPNRAVTALAETSSRRAMTSGTLKTVPDESVFMRYLLKRLTENSEPYLSAQSLFSSFREAVINNLPAGSNLIPQYGIVQEAGDEGGDFVFVKK